MKRAKKIKIYKIMKTNGRCMSHKMGHGTKFRLIQKYLNAYMFIVIALKKKNEMGWACGAYG